MKLYKSNELNTFHYVTLVTHSRVPVFRSDSACEIFVDALRETRERYPYKLIGYVLMPDHVHACGLDCASIQPNGSGQATEHTCHISQASAN